MVFIGDWGYLTNAHYRTTVYRDGVCSLAVIVVSLGGSSNGKT